MAGRTTRKVNYRYLPFARRRGINPSRGVAGHHKGPLSARLTPPVGEPQPDHKQRTCRPKREEPQPAQNASKKSRSSRRREVRSNTNKKQQPKKAKAGSDSKNPSECPNRGDLGKTNNHSPFKRCKLTKKEVFNETELRWVIN